MTSKLDILAQKEEELRKINEQLDLKNDKIMSGALEQLRKEHDGESAKNDDAVEDSMAAGDADQFKGQLMKPLDDEDEDDDYDQYDNDGFEESKQGGSVTKESAKARGLGLGLGKVNDDLDVEDSALQGEMYSELKSKYEDLQMQTTD